MIDFKKQFKAWYTPSINSPEVVEVPPIQYLMVNGKGNPNTSKQFELAVGALYSVFYTVKFDRKKLGIGPDFSSGPLQGLWWMGDNTSFDAKKKDDWLWTLMMWLPDFVTKQDVATALAGLRIKKPNPLYDALRLDVFNEGKVVQIMHIGPYSAEGPTVELLHRFATEEGYALRGKHHEIYLGDPRRAKPEKLRTIIRHPIEVIKDSHG